MRYLKIKSIIFEIELFDDSKNMESDKNIINEEYALYTTNKFKILNYNHIAQNEITQDDFEKCIFYLYKEEMYNKIINDKINYIALIVKIIKESYNIYNIKDLINKKINKHIYYFKSYERAFNFRFIIDKQYELFTNGFSGIYRNWSRYGTLVIEFYHINGKIEGMCKLKYYECYYVNDKPIGNGINSSDLILLDNYHFDYE